MKKVMFGLLVAATAAGMSAFTNAPAKSRQAMRYWINNGSGNYVERTSISPQESCAETSQFDCAVQSQNTSIPSTFPVTNPSNYPVTAHPESRKALYLE